MNPNSAFLTALDWVLDIEKGFVNHPDDPGGATNHGVALRTVRLRDVDRDGQLDFDLDHDGDVDEHDIRVMPLEKAQQFFREEYWSLAGAGAKFKLSCDSLPYAWSIAVFDAAVLQGPRTAVALMQRAIGVKDDGILGPGTLNRLRTYPELEGIGLFQGMRLDRMRKHPKVDTFFKGWAKRLAILDMRLGRSIMKEM